MSVSVLSQLDLSGSESNTVVYFGLFEGKDPHPSQEPGYIVMSSFLVFYKWLLTCCSAKTGVIQNVQSSPRLNFYFPTASVSVSIPLAPVSCTWTGGNVWCKVPPATHLHFPSRRGPEVEEKTPPSWTDPLSWRCFVRRAEPLLTNYTSSSSNLKLWGEGSVSLWLIRPFLIFCFCEIGRRWKNYQQEV